MHKVVHKYITICYINYMSVRATTGDSSVHAAWCVCCSNKVFKMLLVNSILNWNIWRMAFYVAIVTVQKSTFLIILGYYRNFNVNCWPLSFILKWSRNNKPHYTRREYEIQLRRKYSRAIKLNFEIELTWRNNSKIKQAYNCVWNVVII